MVIKLATLNLCLGLQNKKNSVKNLIKNEKIDVLCLQETELTNNLDHGLLSIPGFEFESENNDVKSRVGIYVNSSIKYTRKTTLEGENSHIVIIDIIEPKNLRVINIYRCFNPPTMHSPKTFFSYQVSLIKAACTSSTIVLGDFNLDWRMKGLHSYPFKNYFRELDTELADFNLTQIVKTTTWTRLVGQTLRESILDHVYTSNPLATSCLKDTKPTFGDHFMISFNYDCERPKPEINYRRAWNNYSKEKLCEKLSEVDWSCSCDTVQDIWNSFENKIINVVDDIVPVSQFYNNTYCVDKIPDYVKRKEDQRKRLLKKQKKIKSPELAARINILNKEIRSFHHSKRSNKIRKTIIPGNTQSLWKAVKIAKDVNVASLPKILFEDRVAIPTASIPDRFASYFDEKIKTLLSSVKIENDVYNGKKKMDAENKMFMTTKDVEECLKMLKNKNSEGFDRIPQRILVDGKDYLLDPLSKLFVKIYNERKIPQQWKIARTIPIFKNKGDKNEICNYRPIANLCSTSKIFEKLILKRILELQESNNIDLTGVDQHGFKKGMGTSTLSIQLQSLIARALDDGEFVLVSSLDLSAAFDLVDVNLLLKRLKIIGFPSDVFELIKEWLSERFFYVDIDGRNSYLYELLLGTVQGSILGPILYSIFTSPLFDKAILLSYADDNFIHKRNKSKEDLVKDMEREIESITKWLRKSGLIVNVVKTEVCLFYKNDTTTVTLNIMNEMVSSKKMINVLGVTFDSKLNWSTHVALTIKKANKALNAIKLIRKYFSSKELIQIVTSNYYSILFYNSEVWHLPGLNAKLKHDLFVASAIALKMALHYPDNNPSYSDLHRLAKRATPEMYCKYKCAILLYKTFNQKNPMEEWIHLNFDQINTTRQTKFMTSMNKNHSVGNNILINKFHHLNNEIDLDWLNKSLVTFKILCKKQFLSI